MWVWRVWVWVWVCMVGVGVMGVGAVVLSGLTGAVNKTKKKISGLSRSTDLRK